MGKRKEESTPPVDYEEYARLAKSEFADLVQEQVEINEMMKQLKERHEEIGADLTALMIIAKAQKVSIHGEFRATLAKGSNSRLNPKKLLAKGVSSDVIVACTDTSTYHYVVCGKLAEPSPLVEEA